MNRLLAGKQKRENFSFLTTLLGCLTASGKNTVASWSIDLSIESADPNLLKVSWV